MSTRARGDGREQAAMRSPSAHPPAFRPFFSPRAAALGWVCGETCRARAALASLRSFNLSTSETNLFALRVKTLLETLVPDVGPISLVSLKVPESEGLCRAGCSRLFPHLLFTEETGGFKAL